jgi:hypothetical protein
LVSQREVLELKCGSGLEGRDAVTAAPNVRKRLELDASLYQILQILSLTFFEKTPILQTLQASDSQEELLGPGN